MKALGLHFKFTGALLIRTWPCLGASWAQVEVSWAPLGLNLKPHGRLLGSTWSLVRSSWAPLGRSWDASGCLLGLLELQVSPNGFQVASKRPLNTPQPFQVHQNFQRVLYSRQISRYGLFCRSGVSWTPPGLNLRSWTPPVLNFGSSQRHLNSTCFPSGLQV